MHQTVHANDHLLGVGPSYDTTDKWPSFNRSLQVPMVSLVLSAMRLAFSAHTFSSDIYLWLSLFPSASVIARPLQAAF